MTIMLLQSLKICCNVFQHLSLHKPIRRYFQRKTRHAQYACVSMKLMICSCYCHVCTDSTMSVLENGSKERTRVPTVRITYLSISGEKIMGRGAMLEKEEIIIMLVYRDSILIIRCGSWVCITNCFMHLSSSHGMMIGCLTWTGI